MARQLSADQCILLAVHYASEGNIEALHSFTPSRPDALKPELVLCILLTYLPESIEPRHYTTYIGEVASRLYIDVAREDVEVDLSPVKDINEEQARKRVKKLHLHEIQPPEFPPNAPQDILVRFLCHRAYRIDAETGLLNLVPELVKPFLDRSNFLRTWYISVVLPMLRLELDYYPQDESLTMPLNEFETLDGKEGVEFLLKHVTGQTEDLALHPSTSASIELARDLRGLVGPWMYGHTARKRRKLNSADDAEESAKLSAGIRKISLAGVTTDDQTGHDWEYVYSWMVLQSRESFHHITRAIEEWNGPADIDLGDVQPGSSNLYLEEEVQQKLEARYAQTAIASCYAVRADTEEVIQGAHAILARLAEILDFIPPPDLATSVEALPQLERTVTSVEGLASADLEPDALLRPEHPLTNPKLATYMLLQMFVYSAYQLVGLDCPTSIVHVAKIQLYSSPDDQLQLFQKILRGLAKSTTRQDETQWASARAKLIWLWNWGIDAEDETATEGAGVFGRIPRHVFEEEMLKCFTDASCYDLASKVYLKPTQRLLSDDQIEGIILAKAYEAYDGASNCNKTRGGMKKASDILAAFRSYFPKSNGFRKVAALIAATHSLSFYSLTLQHGVPLRPVSIRVSSDPIGLLAKVLERNPKSYTKLDDLIGIGKNLVAAGLSQEHDDAGDLKVPTSREDLEQQMEDAGRRVSFMAIEAALKEDDFETAYSYIVNRLTPSGTDISAPPDPQTQHKRNISTSSTQNKLNVDDISWRAAFTAGSFRPSNSSSPSLRRLEQRTELLSLALLLAPVSALTEILAAWRRCEEETTALQLSQQQAEEEFDDRADKRLSASGLPGNFTLAGEGQPALVLDQKRREMGRMTGRGDAPVSMFDLTRSAAQAFSKNAWTAGGNAKGSGASGQQAEESATASYDSDGESQQRVRKRDYVANAASGALASGLGWVLGATPAQQQQRSASSQY